MMLAKQSPFDKVALAAYWRISFWFEIGAKSRLMITVSSIVFTSRRQIVNQLQKGITECFSNTGINDAASCLAISPLTRKIFVKE